MVLKYRFCVLTLFIILITCYIILLFVFINITFTVVCFLRYPFDVTLCLCIPSYFERQNYFMMWLCTYVSCHTLNDKIILWCDSVPMYLVILWMTKLFYSLILLLLLTNFFCDIHFTWLCTYVSRHTLNHTIILFIIITLTAKSVFVISILRDCIYASRHTLNDKIISCLPVRISNAQFYTSTHTLLPWWVHFT